MKEIVQLWIPWLIEGLLISGAIVLLVRWSPGLSRVAVAALVAIGAGVWGWLMSLAPAGSRHGFEAVLALALTVHSLPATVAAVVVERRTRGLAVSPWTFLLGAGVFYLASLLAFGIYFIWMLI